MFVRVECLWDEGTQVSREALLKRKMNSICGELVIEGHQDEYLKRYYRVARLMNGDFESLSPLLDAAVLWARGSAMTITGFERDEVLNKTFAQTWRVEIVKAASVPVKLVPETAS